MPVGVFAFYTATQPLPVEAIFALRCHWSLRLRSGAVLVRGPPTTPAILLVCVTFISPFISIEGRVFFQIVLPDIYVNFATETLEVFFEVCDSSALPKVFDYLIGLQEAV